MTDATELDEADLRRQAAHIVNGPNPEPNNYWWAVQVNLLFAALSSARADAAQARDYVNGCLKEAAHDLEMWQDRAEAAEQAIERAWDEGKRATWSALGAPFVWFAPENPYRATPTTPEETR